MDGNDLNNILYETPKTLVILVNMVQAKVE